LEIKKDEGKCKTQESSHKEQQVFINHAIIPFHYLGKNKSQNN
jgi:hypothetical protein